MLALAALGKLDNRRSGAMIFPAGCAVGTDIKTTPGQSSREIVALLAANGRSDLVEAVQSLLRQYHRRQAFLTLDRRLFGGLIARSAVAARGLPAYTKNQIRTVDHQYFGRVLTRTVRKLRSRAVTPPQDACVMSLPHWVPNYTESPLQLWFAACPVANPLQDGSGKHYAQGYKTFDKAVFKGFAI